jgi:hypothetical protein
MVKGLGLFAAHFSEYKDHYILIGGGACDVQFGERAVAFRATKDLDIVLIVEVINNAFVDHFWDFVKRGQYVIAEVDEKRCFYRFKSPATEGYPSMLELFSRKPDTITIKPGLHITDIPTGEEVSSLSAILLDDDYYHFTITNSALVGGVHVAGEAALVCLKARAFLNNKKRRAEGQNVQDGDITKHKNDVLRLVAVLDPAEKINVPAIVEADLRDYIQFLKDDEVAVRGLLGSIGLRNIALEEIVERMQDVFGLREDLIETSN